MTTHQELKTKVKEADQAHLLKFWEELNEMEQKALADQIGELDLKRINRIFKTATEAPPSPLVKELAPLPDPTFGSLIDKDPGFSVEEAREAGLAAMASGQVAVLLLAGGQGTRLGSSAPKGCYDIQLPTHKSLFQLQAERLHKMELIARKHPAAKGHKSVIPWYVMTSGPTRVETEKFFQEKHFFGLDAKNVSFFNQGIFSCHAVHC
jgi:UDP-N-acetylglucosamine/UDP-N-acetylgalactosamine diphosphorylase